MLACKRRGESIYLKVSPSLRDVSGESSRQSDVRVGVDEDFHIQHVQDILVVKSKDAFEDEDVCAVHRHRLVVPAVSHEVVNRNLHLLALLQVL